MEIPKKIEKLRKASLGELILVHSHYLEFKNLSTLKDVEVIFKCILGINKSVLVPQADSKKFMLVLDDVAELAVMYDEHNDRQLTYTYNSSAIPIHCHPDIGIFQHLHDRIELDQNTYVHIGLQDSHNFLNREKAKRLLLDPLREYYRAYI